MKSKKAFLIAAGIWVLVVFIAWWQSSKKEDGSILSPFVALMPAPSPTPKPLEKYELENLINRGGEPSEIRLEKELDKNSNFTSHLFSYTSDDRKVTGLLNLPTGKGPFPVIVMLRGYVDQEIYETGVGTSRAGEVFAKNGYLTIAPDFLGYGESDMPPNNVWEERFLRLTCVLDLLVSLNSLAEADKDNVFIWGHSNGGMIALSILSLTSKDYPASLWAPVSQFFPYDILYYTFEFDDKGKALRKSLAEFEADYEANKYSFDEYINLIKAPIQLHQGYSDEYIPVFWSDNLVEELKDLEIEVDYYKYPNTDHNMSGSWNAVVQRDMAFFKSKLK
ncbi:alpha/beta hydrolase family protein [Patescibacteria group bacterium]